ncbi:hypothetical protein Bca52824_022991 [Brassica carinata]|uniref:Uncharacterized protein n=1 Tax=Brassica carinata TaxID=52824 RepID=A0A8X7VHQ1_BRACI|nr:hypothetical protein Bca52824_022991 [Brassica carinata]
MTYGEFVSVCGEASSDLDQGGRIAKMLDNSVNVIVLGDSVCIRPDQVTGVQQTYSQFHHEGAPNILLDSVVSTYTRQILDGLNYVHGEGFKNCRGVGEDTRGAMAEQLVSCDNLVELSLVNCVVAPGRGPACVLRECKSLEKLRLDMCIGVSDSDIKTLVEKAKHLRSISLRVPSDFTLPLLNSNVAVGLTDESLSDIAQHCSKLESFKVSFSDCEFPSLFSLLQVTRQCQLHQTVR